MRRNDRLFDLIQILRDGQLHRAADLGRRLGVSTRTIWRDMATLVASGLPIEGERGVGYVMRAPVSLPPLALTRDEFEALRLGLALAASAADPVSARAAATLRSKIGAVAPQGLQDGGAETFVYSSPEAARAAPHLALIRRAIREHLFLIAHEDGARETRLRPLHLDYWGRVWTLVGWSETMNDFCVLRVDLLVSLEVDGAFLPEAAKSLDAYIARITRR